ncbi:MAG TPA: hypothetical protein ENJ45_01210, partial [Phaeodactylibacter sp.]|nr:hypothetical protein [Phaeodactylibacter sp.]
MHIAIQFFVLLVFSVVLLSLIRSKWIAKIVAILLAAFYVLELSSVYMGGSLIDYKYYIHTGATDVELMFGFFLKETLMAAVAWLFFFWMFYYLSRKMSVWSSKKMLSLPLLFGSIALMCLPKGVLHQLNEVRQLVYVEAHSMVEACKSLGLPVDKFVYEEEHSKAVKGKNIIVISLESLEQGLLREPFEELSPHLRKLSEKYTYYDMHQNPGSDWTAASLYTALTGFPAYFRSKPNEIFLDVEELKGNNVGKVLNSAGYDLTYLMGKKEFAGTEDMLRTFHFEVLSEKDFPGKYPYCEWGLHDKDLFAEAKNIVRQKQQDDKPFALFLSTIGTHL